MSKRLGLIAAVLLHASAAVAQPSPSALLGAPEAAGARVVVAAAGKACEGANGGPFVLEPGFATRTDLTGNGRADYILDFTYARCERRGRTACGTGGCELSIVVALPGGKFREVFRQQVIRYEIEPGGTMRTIRFDLHGAFCGKTGPEPCVKRQLITGQRFVFREP